MRPEKLTDAGRDRLREIAVLKSRIPRTKQLALELNISPNYVRQILSILGRQISHKCAEQAHMTEVERLIDDIRDESRQRLNEPQGAKVLLGKRQKKYPKTEIIARAAQAAYEARIAQSEQPESIESTGS